MSGQSAALRELHHFSCPACEKIMPLLTAQARARCCSDLAAAAAAPRQHDVAALVMQRVAPLQLLVSVDRMLNFPA